MSQTFFNAKNIFRSREQLHLLLAKMRKSRIVDQDDIAFELLEEPPPDLVDIYQALHITWPKKFSHQINL